ncbi:aldolase/citrate lyase family protein [Shigella sonnei]
MFDLEDSVAFREKDTARRMASHRAATSALSRY